MAPDTKMTFMWASRMQYLNHIIVCNTCVSFVMCFHEIEKYICSHHGVFFIVQMQEALCPQVLLCHCLQQHLLCHWQPHHQVYFSPHRQARLMQRGGGN